MNSRERKIPETVMTIMPRQTNITRIIALAILSVAVLSIALTALAQTQAQPKLFMTLTSKAVAIDYYNASNTAEPTLIIHAYLNNTPAPITISLFAYTPTKIYTVGYYYGTGTVSINLTGTLIREIAGEWHVTGAWPSLLVFVTYVSNEANTIRFMILAIPYDPGWIVNNRHIAMVTTVNLTMAKPLPIPRNITKTVVSTTMSNAEINTTDPYGYSYEGSCMGNSVVLNNPPGLPSSSSWQLESCYEFNGPIPFFFVSWGSDVWSSGITYINIGLGGQNYAQSGSGFYATYAIYNYSNDNYVTTVTSGSPTITFSSEINIYINSFCGETGSVAVGYGSSLNLECSKGTPTYYVPGSGSLFLAAIGNVAAVTFLDCLYQGGSCIPIYVANGTMVLSLSSSSYSPGTLYVYPYIDISNGSITNTLTLLTKQGLAGKAFALLDGQSYYYNPATNLISETTECNNAPSPAQVADNYVTYNIQNVINTYTPVIPGWAPDVGGAIAEILADFIFDDPIIAHLIGFGVTYMLSGLASGSGIYQTYYVKIGTNPSSVWGFYVTFVGTPAIETSQDASSYWPMGVVINSSGYYLSNVIGYQCQR